MGHIKSPAAQNRGQGTRKTHSSLITSTKYTSGILWLRGAVKNNKKLSTGHPPALVWQILEYGAAAALAF